MRQIIISKKKNHLALKTFKPYHICHQKRSSMRIKCIIIIILQPVFKKICAFQPHKRGCSEGEQSRKQGYVEEGDIAYMRLDEA